MKRKPITLLLSLAVIVSLMSIGCAPEEAAPAEEEEEAPPAEEEVYSIRLSQGSGRVGEEGLIYAEYASKFAKVVDELSNGRVKIRLFGPGELYPSYPDMAAACMAGELDAYWGDIAMALSYQGLPETEIAFRFPAIGPDIEDRVAYVQEFMETAQGERTKQLMADKGVTLLEWTPVGVSGIALTQKAETMADFSKLKIRGSGGLALVAGEALTATPVQISWGEVPMALKTGVVDGVYTDAPSICSAELWGVGCTHFTGNYMAYLAFAGLLVHTGLLEEMPTHARTVIEQAAEQMDPWSETRALELNEASVAELGEHMTIYDLAPDVILAAQERYAAKAYPDLETTDADMFEEMLSIYSQWTPE